MRFTDGDEVLITAAEIGIRRNRAAFRSGIEEAMRTGLPFPVKRQLAFWPCASDFGLQAVDYSLWAVCRSWERDDTTYRSIIADKIRSEVPIDADGNPVPKGTNPRPTRLVSQSPGALSSDGVALVSE